MPLVAEYMELGSLSMTQQRYMGPSHVFKWALTTLEDRVATLKNKKYHIGLLILITVPTPMV